MDFFYHLSQNRDDLVRKYRASVSEHLPPVTHDTVKMDIENYGSMFLTFFVALLVTATVFVAEKRFFCERK